MWPKKTQVERNVLLNQFTLWFELVLVEGNPKYKVFPKSFSPKINKALKVFRVKSNFSPLFSPMQMHSAAKSP